MRQLLLDETQNNISISSKELTHFYYYLIDWIIFLWQFFNVNYIMWKC